LFPVQISVSKENICQCVRVHIDKSYAAHLVESTTRTLGADKKDKR